MLNLQEINRNNTHTALYPIDLSLKNRQCEIRLPSLAATSVGWFSLTDCQEYACWMVEMSKGFGISLPGADI
jgi:hypothetical protein